MARTSSILLNHLLLKLPSLKIARGAFEAVTADRSLKFNIGEMGLLLRKS